MLYVVFNNKSEVTEANERWLTARTLAGVCDCKQGVPVNPSITNARDWGRVMNDGRIACQYPPTFATEFGGVETELTEDDFPVIETEV